MSIEERMAELERKNRRLSFTLIFAGGTVALLVVLASCTGMAPTGNAPLDRVTARQFVLVDAEGKMRAALGVDEKRPGLWLYDEKGMALAELSIVEEGLEKGPVLCLYDEKGKRVVVIGTSEGGGGGIMEVFNNLGKKAVTIQADKRNCGAVGVYDYNGELKRALTAN